ncbi:MAG: helix-turn-helix domain-containing protein [Gammaproteobacteria bacterium]|nr:helix-turn-helix domain-containing protein [Gammaproteobacteria bacterium]
MHHGSTDPLLTEHDIARRLAISIATVRRWRIGRTGVPFIKLGASVRYRPEDLRAYIDSRISAKEVA